MISPFVKAYVHIEAWKHKRKIDGISDILIRELSLFDYWKGKIRYSWFWSAGVHVPNASATIPGLILINAEWASRIVLNQDNPHMHDAFALTIGHEITHQEKDFYYFNLFSNDGKFVNCVDEVHADFGGVHKGYVFEDGVIWYEVIKKIYKNAEAEVYGFKLPVEVALIQTEFWSSDDAESRYYFEPWDVGSMTGH